MAKLELSQYIAQMLDQLADLADDDSGDDRLVKCAFQMRLLAETLHPQKQVRTEAGVEKDRLH